MKIAILGTGLMGRVLSMRLYQEGYHDLHLFEEDHLPGTKSPAYIAAGMIAPLSESILGGKLIYKLGIRSSYLWTQYLANLNASELYNNKGTILLTNAHEQNESKHYLQKISLNSEQNNYYQSLDKNNLQQLEPELNFNHAYYLTQEGSLDARSVLATLTHYLHEAQISWQTGTKVEYDLIKHKVYCQEKILSFDWVLDCRGLGARQIFPNLRGVRGEIIRLYAPEVKLSRPVRLLHPRHNIYIVPLPAQYYIIGASEIEAEDYSAISVRSNLELLTMAYTVHNGFAEARILEMNTNCRPTFPNNLPQLKHSANYIAINGLYRHGFLLAPALAEELLHYLTNGIKLTQNIWS